MIRIIAKQPIPGLRYRPILIKILTKDEDRLAKAADVFNYGVIVGKQLERAKRKPCITN